MKFRGPYDPSTGASNDGLSWTNGNPSTGLEGSIPPHEAMTDAMSEIENVISQAGLTPDHDNLTQLWAAIQSAIQLAGSSFVDVIGQTHAYSSTDLGKITARSNGGTPMIDTLPGGASALAAKSLLVVYNKDATALLAVTANAGSLLKNGDLPHLILGPGQSASIVSDGTNYYVLTKPTRILLGADTTFYISTTGSNTDLGITSARAWATKQSAWDTLAKFFDLNGYVATIQIADGNYTDSLNATHAIPGALSTPSGDDPVIRVKFLGNVSAPQNVSISTTATCFAAGQNCMVVVQGVQLAATAGPLMRASGGKISFANVRLGASAGDPDGHLVANNYGIIHVNGDFSIIAGAPACFHARTGGQVIVKPGGVTVTITGTPAFSQYFAFAEKLGLLKTEAITFVGAATGQRYYAKENGVITTNGGGANYFPGSVAGAVADGGVYT